MADRDFALDMTGRLVLRNGGVATNESLTQEVAMLLLTNQGEIRHDPLCGCNLIRRTNARITRSELERLIRMQVERDGHLWAKVKDGVKLFMQQHG